MSEDIWRILGPRLSDSLTDEALSGSRPRAA